MLLGGVELCRCNVGTVRSCFDELGPRTGCKMELASATTLRGQKKIVRTAGVTSNVDIEPALCARPWLTVCERRPQRRALNGERKFLSQPLGQVRILRRTEGFFDF